MYLGVFLEINEIQYTLFFSQRKKHTSREDKSERQDKIETITS